MAVIRRLERNDFPAVCALFNYERDEAELKWLFESRDGKDIYNAYVAEYNKEIVGVISYLTDSYVYEEKNYQGVIPISWMISNNYKGLAGVLLFKKVFNQGDLGMAISGSSTARDLYSLFKFGFVGNAHVYFRITSFNNLYSVVRKRTFLKTIGFITYLLPTFFRNKIKAKKASQLSFSIYKGNIFNNEKDHFSVFRKKVSKKYIDWLLACPNVDSYAFLIKKGQQYLGICVVYVGRKGKGKVGRIAYLPYLGDDLNLWYETIDYCVAFLKEKNCSMVSGIAYHELNHKGLVISKFKKIDRYSLPIYSKSINKNVGLINWNNWMFQFSEGDNAFRDF